MIATEVRKLAERPRASSAQVGDIAATLKQLSRAGIDESTAALTHGQEGSRQASAALDAMREVIDDAEARGSRPADQ